MTFDELKHKSKSVYPAILLDYYVPLKSRKLIRRITFYALIFVFLLMMAAEYSLGSFLSDNIFRFRGGFFVIFVLWITFYLLEGFFLSYYFKNNKICFEVAQLSFFLDSNDLTSSFLNSEIGLYTMARLNISKKTLASFSNKSDREKIHENDINIIENKEGAVTVLNYAHAIYKQDKDFALFLSNNFIDERMFLETLYWVSETIYQTVKAEYFFDKENLERIPSVGRNLSLDNTAALNKYCQPLYKNIIYQSLKNHWKIYKKEATQIENLLLQEDGKNIMLVVPTNESGLEIVSALGKMIITGVARSQIEHKSVFILDYDVFIKDSITKEDFENNIKNILVDVHNNGDIILVIPNVAKFTEKAYELGIDILSFISSSLLSKEISIIAIADGDSYYSSLETNQDFVRNFEKLNINQVDNKTLIRILQEEIHRAEFKYDVFFTYPAVKKIADIFQSSLIQGSYLRRIVDFIDKISERAKNQNKKIITASLIEQI